MSRSNSNENSPIALPDDASSSIRLIKPYRMPPYGREVLASSRLNKKLNTFCFTGRSAWEKARARRTSHGLGSAMLLPPGEEAEEFCWPVVSNGILVVAEDELGALRLARAIVIRGTPVAYAIFGNLSALIVYGSNFSTKAATK